MLGRQTYSLKAGESKSIKLKLASGTAKLAKKRKLGVSARIFSQGAAERTAKVTLSSNVGSGGRRFRDLDRRGLAALASGHAVADLCQGSVPALIPFLISERGYSYSAVGALLLFVTVGSSIIQPAFGAVSDRLSISWLMPVGVAFAAIGIGLAGVTPSFASPPWPSGSAASASPPSTRRARATPTTPPAAAAAPG